MSPSFTIPRRLAADAFDETHAFHRIEDTIIRGEDLYELDGETFLRNRGGRIETGSSETFEQEVW